MDRLTFSPYQLITPQYADTLWVYAHAWCCVHSSSLWKEWNSHWKELYSRNFVYIQSVSCVLVLMTVVCIVCSVLFCSLMGGGLFLDTSTLRPVHSWPIA